MRRSAYVRFWAAVGGLSCALWAFSIPAQPPDRLVTRPGLHFAHAVNSAARLWAALKDPAVDCLEADVLLAEGASTASVPILSHPPQRHSDLSLADLLDAISHHNTRHPTTTKQLKLDFKEPAVVDVSLRMLKEKERKSLPELWLNADILQGPGGSPSAFDPRHFIAQCRRAFPAARLSLGWTTGVSLIHSRYTPAMVDEMLAVCAGLRNVTFAVHAFYASQSPGSMARLIAAGHTLTLWGVADRTVLLWAQSLPAGSYYVDVEEPALWQRLWSGLARFGNWLRSP